MMMVLLVVYLARPINVIYLFFPSNQLSGEEEVPS